MNPLHFSLKFRYGKTMNNIFYIDEENGLVLSSYVVTPMHNPLGSAVKVVLTNTDTAKQIELSLTQYGGLVDAIQKNLIRPTNITNRPALPAGQDNSRTEHSTDTAPGS